MYRNLQMQTRQQSRDLPINYSYIYIFIYKYIIYIYSYINRIHTSYTSYILVTTSSSWRLLTLLNIWFIWSARSLSASTVASPSSSDRKAKGSIANWAKFHWQPKELSAFFLCVFPKRTIRILDLYHNSQRASFMPMKKSIYSWFMTYHWTLLPLALNSKMLGKTMAKQWYLFADMEVTQLRVYFGSWSHKLLLHTRGFACVAQSCLRIMDLRWSLPLRYGNWSLEALHLLKLFTSWMFVSFIVFAFGKAMKAAQHKQNM